MLPDVSAAARGGEAVVGVGESVRRCVSSVVCAVRDVSISCGEGVVSIIKYRE